MLRPLFCRSTAAAGAAAGAAPEDSTLTHEVGAAVIDWIAERLSDYHIRLGGVGGPDSLSGLVDVLAFAAVSRGANAIEVGDMVAAAVRSSVEKGKFRSATVMYAVCFIICSSAA